MLDPQCAVVQQVRRRTGDNCAYRAEPIGFVRERSAGFEAQIALQQMRIVGPDIRRVADDHVEPLWPGGLRRRCSRDARFTLIRITGNRSSKRTLGL